jgi:hypothetical protein
MSDETKLPSATTILAAPELATLAILDTALAVARTALRNEYPDYPDLGEPDDLFFVGRAPSDSLVRASLIVYRIDDLRSLIQAYRACLRHETSRMPLDGLPF